MTERILGLILGYIIGICYISMGIADCERNIFGSKYIRWFSIISGLILIIICFLDCV